MKVAGCSPEQILSAIEYQAGLEDESQKEHRAKRAEQKRLERERKAGMSLNVAATTSDIMRQTSCRSDTSPSSSPSDGFPPVPYIRNIDTPPSLTPSSSPSRKERKYCPNPLFDRFWAIYPLKVGKGQAQRAWLGAVRKADAEKIIDGVERYPWPSDPAFLPHASTWLNGLRWEDDLPGMKPAKLSQADLDDQERKRLEFLKDLHRRAGHVSENN
jgi:hypothetical protein